MRRVGKSTLLEQWRNFLQEQAGIVDSRILFVQCDSLEYSELRHWRQLKELVSPMEETIGKEYLLVDEIQHIAEWERVVTALHRNEDWDIYITGSNSEMLSGELATRLSGRYVEMHVFPFSYREHLEIRRVEKHEPAEFSNYLHYGGIPILYHVADDDLMNFRSLNPYTTPLF